MERLSAAVVGAAEVVAALDGDRHQRREYEGDDGGDRRVRLECVAEGVEVHGGGQAGGGHEGDTAHRVDGVEHAAAELRSERGDLEYVLVHAPHLLLATPDRAAPLRALLCSVGIRFGVCVKGIEHVLRFVSGSEMRGGRMGGCCPGSVV
jgi:hypothetical protein